jgi:hypothetical protein
VSELERAAGVEQFSVRGMGGYKSLARHANVSLDKVLAHARNGTLAALVSPEMRDRSRESRSRESRARSSGLDPRQCLVYLWSVREL